MVMSREASKDINMRMVGEMGDALVVKRLNRYFLPYIIKRDRILNGYVLAIQ